MKKLILPIAAICLLSSCYRQVTIKLSAKEPEIYTNGELKKILSKKSPSIVLRTPEGGAWSMTSETAFDNSIVYKTIEKELMKAGFTVRDRTIFEKVTARYDMDYSKLKELSNTDLVLQLVDITSKQITTNKYYTPKGMERRFKDNKSFIARSFEFRLINIKENEISGSYTFYYVPCADGGCNYMIDKKGTLFIPDSKLPYTNTYEFMSADVTEEFTKMMTQRLIQELRK